MKCCNKDLGKGTPFVMVRYWCDTCKTEHLVNAEDMTEYLAKLAAETTDARLPPLL